MVVNRFTMGDNIEVRPSKIKSVRLLKVRSFCTFLNSYKLAPGPIYSIAWLMSLMLRSRQPF